MALTEAEDLTLADQLHAMADRMRTTADWLDDEACALDCGQVGRPLAEVAEMNRRIADFTPEPIAIADVKVRDEIRLSRGHGFMTQPRTVAAVDADAQRQATLPMIDGRRCLALRLPNGDIDVGWWLLEHTAQLVYRPAPLEDVPMVDAEEWVGRLVADLDDDAAGERP